MAETQTDNLTDEQLVPDVSPESIDGLDSGDFFSRLDQQVNAGILDMDDSGQQSAPLEGQQSMSGEMTAQTENQQHDWEKRYNDSSIEAQRLNSRLTELEEFSPILDAMKKDPELVSHIQGYFKGGGETPKSMKESLGLDEDFIFDLDEAMSDADSDSAKVFQATVDGVVSRRLNNYSTQQEQKSQRESKEVEFRARHEMNDEQWNKFMSYAKGRSLTLDDIYFLMNREQRDKNVAQSTRQEMADQMRRVRQKPQSLSSVGSDKVEQSQENKVFDAILGIDSELESAFS